MTPRWPISQAQIGISTYCLPTIQSPTPRNKQRLSSLFNRVNVDGSKGVGGRWCGLEITPPPQLLLLAIQSTIINTAVEIQFTTQWHPKRELGVKYHERQIDGSDIQQQ